MRALHRKLLRDLWNIKSQALAIAAVIAVGVVVFTMYLSTFRSLRLTQETYYERYRFADVFAGLKRAPRSLLPRVEAIPGVKRVDARVVADVTLDVPGLVEPATGRLISIPAEDRATLDDVYLTAGRYIEPRRSDEVLVSEGFALAHDLHPGDSVAAILNGRRQELEIVGIALSPEYVYAIRPGDLFPDDRRFGIFWMEEKALANAFDMQGAFNDLALTLEPGVQPEAVIDRLDRLLDRYGGLGAIPRRLQTSNWYLDSELTSLQTVGMIVPVIFLAVAAFLLNVVLGRIVAVQREQIAALKALGYDDREIGLHYLGWGTGDQRRRHRRRPLRRRRDGPRDGRHVQRLLPLPGAALPARPGDRRRRRGGGAGRRRHRRLLRRAPGGEPAAGRSDAPRAAGGVPQELARPAVGGAPAAAVGPHGAAQHPPPPGPRPGLGGRHRLRRRHAGVDHLLLRRLRRDDRRLLRHRPAPGRHGDLLRAGEPPRPLRDRAPARASSTPSRCAPCTPGCASARARGRRRSRAWWRARTSTAWSMPTSGRCAWREGGLVLSDKLARTLGVVEGDEVVVEVLEGARPTRRVPVVQVVKEYLGTNAYMEIGSLRHMMREGGTLSGAFLAVDSAHADELYRRLKRTPKVAGVNLQRAALDTFRQTLDETMGLFLVFNVLFAGVIAFGVVYNAARVSLSERSRELASLRVLGFTKREVAAILLGELALLTVVSLPVGMAIGYWLADLIVRVYDTELYRFPLVILPRTYALACLTVLAAATVSGLVVRRKLGRLDLVAVLKTRE